MPAARVDVLAHVICRSEACQPARLSGRALPERLACLLLLGWPPPGPGPTCEPSWIGAMSNVLAGWKKLYCSGGVAPVPVVHSTKDWLLLAMQFMLATALSWIR